MKLLIDLSHIAHGCWNTSASKGVVLWKHLILSIIQNHLSLFSPNQVIIATDKPSWREDFYKNYKIRRKRRDINNQEKKYFKEQVNNFIKELIQFFPFHTLDIEKCEADDIIGVLTHFFSQNNPEEEITIVTRDKDFIQLLKYPNVKIYDPWKKEFVKEDAEKYLYCQILKGDSCDDVPNFLSDDDVFEKKDKKQTPLRSTFVELMYSKEFKPVKKSSGYSFNIPLELAEFAAKKFKNRGAIDNLCKNYSRNQTLIDFNFIPRNIKYAITNSYNNYTPITDKKLLEQYLYKNELIQIISKIDLFFMR